MNKLLTTLFVALLFSTSCVKTDHFPTHTIDSFVKVKRISYIMRCEQNPEKGESICIPKIARSTGSGALVSKGNVGGLVLTAAHPSPLAANRGGFFGCKVFSKTNHYLKQHGIEPIDWQLDA